MQTNTTSSATIKGFQPGLWLMNFQAMGGQVSRCGDMYGLLFPESGDDTLLDMHSVLSVEDRARLRSFLQSHFDGEA